MLVQFDVLIFAVGSEDNWKYCELCNIRFEEKKVSTIVIKLICLVQFIKVANKCHNFYKIKAFQDYS